MLISIVVPIYNEQAALGKFHRILSTELSKIREDFEIIYVNDGSKDSSLNILHGLAEQDSRIKVVNLSRNFGKEIATTAGISISKGDATILMDGDGQHPPKLIPEFIKEWKNGYQVVVGVRTANTNEGFIKKFGSKLFYRLAKALSDGALTPSATDFRLLDSSVRAEFLKFKERQRMTRGLIDWLGFKRQYIPFHAPERMAGEASYSVKKLVGLALNSFVSISLVPLYFAGYVGFVISALSFLGGIFILVEQVLLSDPLNLRFSGTAMLGVLIVFLVGILLISQGLIAIYLSHVYSQTQGRPLFVIDMKNSVGLSRE